MAELKSSNAVVTSTGMFRTGWVLTGFVGLFLLVDGGARLAGFAPYVEGMTTFGYACSQFFGHFSSSFFHWRWGAPPPSAN